MLGPTHYMAVTEILDYAQRGGSCRSSRTSLRVVWLRCDLAACASNTSTKQGCSCFLAVTTQDTMK